MNNFFTYFVITTFLTLKQSVMVGTALILLFQFFYEAQIYVINLHFYI
jgi:hypothetical protein